MKNHHRALKLSNEMYNKINIYCINSEIKRNALIKQLIYSLDEKKYSKEEIQRFFIYERPFIKNRVIGVSFTSDEYNKITNIATNCRVPFSTVIRYLIYKFLGEY